MFELLGELTDLLRGALDSPWLWVLLFLVAGLDALLPFMPSEGSVMTVAVLLGHDLPALVLLLVVAATGALAGDCLGHWIGRKAGPATLARLQRDEKGIRRYEWARDKVHRHGPVLVIAGRYIPGGRVASGLATGSLRYPFTRFLVLDAVGVTIWATYTVLVGYVGSSRFADDPGKGLLLAFGIGLLVLGCVEVGRRLVSRRGLRDAGLGDGHPRRGTADGGDRGGRTEPGALVSELDCLRPGEPCDTGPVADSRRDGGSER